MSYDDLYVLEVSAREMYTVLVRAGSVAEAKRKARNFDAAWEETSRDAVYNWGTREAVRIHSVKFEAEGTDRPVP